MEENEASVRLEVIRAGLLSGTDAKIVSSEENIKAITVIINALEEIQQYRKHGITIKRALNNMRDLTATENLLEKYRAIGTPEECRAAVEKQKPKAVVEKSMLSHIGTKIGRCPVCLELPLRECDNQYCPGCGQKLEWEAEEVLNRIKIKSLAGLGMTAEEAAMALNTGTRKMFDLYKREKQSKL